MNSSAPLTAPLLSALAAHDASRISWEGRQLLRGQAGETLLNALAGQLYERGATALLLELYTPLLDHLPNSTLNAMLAQAKGITDRGEIRPAIAMLDLVRRRVPHEPGILQQIARRHHMLGEDEQALEMLERTLAMKPDLLEAQYMYVVSRMIHSRFQDGMGEYDIRFKVSPEAWRPTVAPRWQGENLAGKRLYIWGEQGVGDTVMYSAFLPYILAQKPAHVCMGVAPQMETLMRRSFPNVRIVVHMPGEPHPEDSNPEYDYSMPAADVLRYCLPHYTPREHPPLLVPDETLVAEARKSLGAFAGKRMIGISWFTTNETSALVRNVALEKWAPVFSVPDCIFFSLQHGPGVKDQVAHAAAQGFPVYMDPGLDPISQLDGLVALTAALDEVITIQATAGHLGGGLGKPTTILCSKARDFSWVCEPCPWYGSVHVEYQQEALLWEPVMARVAEDLARRVKKAA